MFLIPLCGKADNLIFNSGFDMTPWDTGWVSEKTNANDYAKADTTKYYSSPQSCYLYSYGYYQPGGGPRPGYTSISQIVHKTTSCTCKVYFKSGNLMDEGYYGIQYLQIYLFINNEPVLVWKTKDNIDTIWGKWEQSYADSDTISGIKIGVNADGGWIAGCVGNAFVWIDNINISGKQVGVEEKGFFANTQNDRLEASPNPFAGSTSVNYQSSAPPKAYRIKIYNITGKLVEETNNNVIGKNLKSGIYFIKANNSKLIKIIKMK